MLFKTDENLPIELAELLSSLGHDAKTVNDEHLQGASDPLLMTRCDAERRILVTLDVDFSDIRTYPPDEHEGIIVLRVGNQSRTHVIKVFSRVLKLLEAERIKGRLWVLEENMVRIRGEES
jgi:predicted nuclease of predicted toxin-antitoxin system